MGTYGRRRGSYDAGPSRRPGIWVLDSLGRTLSQSTYLRAKSMPECSMKNRAALFANMQLRCEEDHDHSQLCEAHLRSANEGVCYNFFVSCVASLIAPRGEFHDRPKAECHFLAQR
jgi:hypothetical protein